MALRSKSKSSALSCIFCLKNRDWWKMKKSPEVLDGYVSELQSAIAAIPFLLLEQSAKLIFTRSKSNTVFLAGNGGSAATASHFATDLGVGSLLRKNPVRAISLCENVSVLTATSNDLDYSKVFSQQLELLGKKNDLFIPISASGNSQNLVNGIAKAKSMEMFTIAITGFDGGELSRMADLNIHVPTRIGSYGVTEDVHLSICHIITELLRSYNV